MPRHLYTKELVHQEKSKVLKRREFALKNRQLNEEMSRKILHLPTVNEKCSETEGSFRKSTLGESKTTKILIQSLVHYSMKNYKQSITLEEFITKLKEDELKAREQKTMIRKNQTFKQSQFSIKQLSEIKYDPIKEYNELADINCARKHKINNLVKMKENIKQEE